MPTKGSSMILNASIANGSAIARVAGGRLFRLEVDAFDRAAIDRRRQEVDDGVEQGLPPLFLKAEPQRTGWNARRCTAVRTSLRNVAASGSVPSR